MAILKIDRDFVASFDLHNPSLEFTRNPSAAAKLTAESVELICQRLSFLVDGEFVLMQL